MDQSIKYIMNKYFTNIEEFETSTNTKYIVGLIFNDRYMISKKEDYIITKRINGRDRYVAVYSSEIEVLQLLNKIKNKEELRPNEQAQLLAMITGIGTI